MRNLKRYWVHKSCKPYRSGVNKERGFMAAEWTAAVALLLIPTFIVVVSLLQVPPRKSLTQVASSEAVRAYVQVLDQGQAEAAARAAAVDAIVGELGEDRRSEIQKEIESNGIVKVQLVEATKGYCPGSEITIRVTMPMPVSLNPFSKGGELFSFSSISSTSTERIDDYSEVITSDGCES